MSDTNTDPAKNQGDPDQLGDAGKAALVAERKRADDAEKRVKELEADVARATQERDQATTDAAAQKQALEAQITELTTGKTELEAKVIRLEVGIDAELPRDLIDRMRGGDETELRADAEKLKAFVPDNSNTFPKPDPSQGAKENQAGGTNADRFASIVDAKLT